ncbi:16150_t:CDS:2 [Racocetra fulgida]|uniref:16150_t:CDS:1 n=1 Tax=Racocetra fulgida TaxID=60492 RepID=A0A9N9G5M6_9GLOM|nr:16150_t:CDS:2 [Racocetra fulgida]
MRNNFVMATHNSYAFGNAIAANQHYNISTQLKDGVRVFLLAVLKNPDPTKSDIELCHTSCELLDAGTAADTLQNIATFLQNNPNDIITIFWRNYFSNLTAADIKTASDKADQRRPIYMLNHFLYTEVKSGPLDIDLPTRVTANLTNSASLQKHAQNCTTIFKQFPNFITVDFYDQGSPNLNPFSIVANYNGVQYTPTTYGNGVLPNDIATSNSAKIDLQTSLFTAFVSLLIVFIFAVVEL